MCDAFVDISVYTKDSAVGVLSGSMRFPVVPSVGDTISFDFPAEGYEISEMNSFLGMLRVQSRILRVGSDLTGIQIGLDDLIVQDAADAQIIMSFFEQKYDLTPDYF